MIPTVQRQEAVNGRLQSVLKRMSAAAIRSNRPPADIKLVAVTKTHPPELVRAAIAAGVTDFGENRVQEAEAKIHEVGKQTARWHLIGHLQSNKARRAVELFDVIQSLDSVALARKLEKACADLNRKELPVLVQIDLGHEPTKTGIQEHDLANLLDAISDCKHLRLTGLMTIPPYFDEVEQVRPYFRGLRVLRDKLGSQSAFAGSAGDLSMGMTHDFEIAIEEGATMVRVGTAIFGERA